MKPHLLIALTGAVVASGCDSTGPDDPFELRLTSTVSVPGTTVQPDSTLRIACNVTLRARATGYGDDAAVWEDGELRWFAGVDRTQPLAVDALSQDDVRAFWQSDRLVVDGLLTGGWELSAGVPFTTEAEFRYPRQRLGSAALGGHRTPLRPRSGLDGRGAARRHECHGAGTDPVGVR